jgi:hypothetical protein
MWEAQELRYSIGFLRAITAGPSFYALRTLIKAGKRLRPFKLFMTVFVGWGLIGMRGPTEAVIMAPIFKVSGPKFTCATWRCFDRRE